MSWAAMREEARRKALPAAATVKKRPLRPLGWWEEEVLVWVGWEDGLDGWVDGWIGGGGIAGGSVRDVDRYLRKDIVVADERGLGGW